MAMRKIVRIATGAALVSAVKDIAAQAGLTGGMQLLGIKPAGAAIELTFTDGGPWTENTTQVIDLTIKKAT
jgi:hypothetical protein